VPTVCIGRVVRAVGLRGYLGVAGWDASFQGVGQVALTRPGEPEGAFRKVVEARPQGKIWAVAVEGIRDRTAAEQAVGSEVFARREDLGDAGDGFHWWADLKGLPVVTKSGQPVGRVTGFFATGGVDVLEVTGESGEKLIPLAPYVTVDFEQGLITVDPPEGLLDLAGKGED
jgi:16S rRNA processing protein RimM